MKILVAPDSFKGSLKSPEVARAMAVGARAAAPHAEVIELPVGDGGEGTLDALVAGTGGSFRTLQVTGPLGSLVQARLGLLGDGKTAFIEMAEASGLSLLSPEQRDPLRATTYGTGELIRAALETDRPRILIGIGGSATNDGGTGALSALGARFLDQAGKELVAGGAALAKLAGIELSAFRSAGNKEIVVACDVSNPLTGKDGASAIYGPQKGASLQDVAALDAALQHYAVVAAGKVGKDWKDAAGAGAAGGLGFALLAFLGGRMERGVDLVLNALRFEEHLAGADLVLTGEGRIDRQTTAFGKTLTGIGARAKSAGVPAVGLAGALGEDVGDYRNAGLSSLVSIVPRPMPLNDAMANARQLVEDAARRTVELFLAGISRC